MPKTTRQNYISMFLDYGFKVRHEDKKHGVIILKNENLNEAVGWKGRQVIREFHKKFSTNERAENFINQFISKIQPQG